MSDQTNDPYLKVYIKPGCPWCVDAVAYLHKHNFEFEELNVTANSELFAEMRELSGQSCAPTLTFGDLMLADFDVGEMTTFFEKHSIEP